MAYHQRPMTKKKIYILFQTLFWALIGPFGALAQEAGSGLASYYSKRLHGHKTSSGERHDTYGFHCAHRELPFGSMVRVTNTANGRSTVVRVNDRGPFGKGRVIDLSLAAAKELRMVGRGIAPVSLEVIYTPLLVRDARLSLLANNAAPDTGSFIVPPSLTYQELQEGQFKNNRYYNSVGEELLLSGICLHADNFGMLENALDAARNLEDQGFTPVVIEPREDHGMMFYRVLVGQFVTPKQTPKAVRRLKDLGHSALLLRYRRHNFND